jgi:hypothetical protein
MAILRKRDRRRVLEVLAGKTASDSRFPRRKPQQRGGPRETQTTKPRGGGKSRGPTAGAVRGAWRSPHVGQAGKASVDGKNCGVQGRGCRRPVAAGVVGTHPVDGLQASQPVDADAVGESLGSWAALTLRASPIATKPRRGPRRSDRSWLSLTACPLGLSRPNSTSAMRRPPMAGLGVR